MKASFTEATLLGSEIRSNLLTLEEPEGGSTLFWWPAGWRHSGAAWIDLMFLPLQMERERVEFVPVPLGFIKKKRTALAGDGVKFGGGYHEETAFPAWKRVIHWCKVMFQHFLAPGLLRARLASGIHPCEH